MQDAGIRYSNEMKGCKQKPALVELKPLVGDVVFLINSEKRKSFGVIVEILNDNQVSIRSKYQGSIQLRSVHVRVLTLLYRPSEWVNDIPAN